MKLILHEDHHRTATPTSPHLSPPHPHPSPSHPHPSPNSMQSFIVSSWPLSLKVRLHGRRQAARLARDMLQRDLLRGNSVYMVGSCRARLLHIIHVSAVSDVGVLQEKCSWQPVPRGNYKFKLKMPPGLAAVARLLRAACCRVNAPVVFLWFYFAARLSRRSRAPCKRSFRHTLRQPATCSQANFSICPTIQSHELRNSIYLYLCDEEMHYQHRTMLP